MRYIPISQLAAVVHVRANPFKTMVLVRAYFDESGIHAKSPIIAAGGLMATEKRWTALEADWLIELGRFKNEGFPISAFHSTECEAGEGEFFDIPKEIRDTFFIRLAKIVEKHAPICLWSSIEQQHWDELADEKFRDAYPHPFYLCFEWCAYEMARWQREVAESSPIALVYSEQQKFKDRVQLIWDAYDRAKRVAPLNTFTTASYKVCVPLQAADLVAYECFRHWKEFAAGSGGLKVARPGARALITPTSNIEMVGHHTRRTLENVIRQFHAGRCTWNNRNRRDFRPAGSAFKPP